MASGRARVGFPTDTLAATLALLVFAVFCLQEAFAQADCKPLSVLYPDNFCGIKMNTSSDLRTVWQIGYPIVQLQPGTYSDAAMHCNLSANVNTAINFTGTVFYTTAKNSVIFNCKMISTVGAGFNLTLSKLWLQRADGIICSGTRSTLKLDNIDFSHTVTALAKIKWGSGCAAVITGDLNLYNLGPSNGIEALSFEDTDVNR
jgi:hypothetical protein